MLTTYPKPPGSLDHSGAAPAGPHLDAFLGWLEARGYQRRRIYHLLRGAHRFSRGPTALGSMSRNSMRSRSRPMGGTSTDSSACAIPVAASATSLWGRATLLPSWQ